MRFLLQHEMRNGTVDQELQWLDEQAPGIFDIRAEPVPQKFRLAQGLAFNAWYTSLPRDEFLERLDLYVAGATALGIELADHPMIHADLLAMRGEIEKAVDVALESVFTQTVAVNLRWREIFAQPHLAEVVADPRIQAAMQRWEEDEAELRNSVRSYLADLQAAA